MRLRHRLALAGLCLLSGSRWLVADALPSTLSNGAKQAVHSALLTLVSAAAARTVPRLRLFLPAFFAFTVPALAFAAAEGHVTATTQTIVFAFTPAVVVFALIQQGRGFGRESEFSSLLFLPLAGALGLMFLIPATVPAAYGRVVLLVAAMIGASLAAVSLHRRLEGDSVFPLATLSSGVTALVLGAFSHPIHWSVMQVTHEVLTTLLLDAPTLFLTLYLLREVQPIPLATRFLLVPLVAIVEGVILLRPHITPALVAGLALITGSAFLLLGETT